MVRVRSSVFLPYCLLYIAWQPVMGRLMYYILAHHFSMPCARHLTLVLSVVKVACCCTRSWRCHNSPVVAGLLWHLLG